MTKPLSQRPRRQDDQEQSRAFIEKAREIGADENSSRAEELIGRLARSPPEPKVKNAPAK